MNIETEARLGGADRACLAGAQVHALGAAHQAQFALAAPAQLGGAQGDELGAATGPGPLVRHHAHVRGAPAQRGEHVAQRRGLRAGDDADRAREQWHRTLAKTKRPYS